jgi:predicted nucleic acid-binding Zn ribbon protein
MTPNPTEPHPDDWADLERRRAAHRGWFYARQPKPVKDVLAQVVQRKGYATVRAAGQFNEAWAAAAGEPFAATTEVGALRRGVLEVYAANSLVMQELTFEKERILAALQTALPDASIKQLRFRVGAIG